MHYGEQIKKAIEVLKDGGIILYPTDTIWGIGCDATKEDAVEKIYRLKEREDWKSMLVVVDGFAMIEEYIEELPSVAQELIDSATRPLTIIYPAASGLAENLLAPDGSIGMRICEADFCSALISAYSKPLVSSSANISGRDFPKGLSSIDSKIKEGVDYICDIQQTETGHVKPSSIIKIGVGNKIEIIRE